MKKFLLIILAFSMILTLCSCTIGKNYASKYAYTDVLIDHDSSEIAEMKDLLHIVYEDTSLKLSDDGTWCIDMNIILFINSNIDEGTYTKDGDMYVFEGFEYGMDAYGYETEDGFNIIFYIEDIQVITLRFAKA